jgi:hypothetical protein
MADSKLPPWLQKGATKDSKAEVAADKKKGIKQTPAEAKTDAKEAAAKKAGAAKKPSMKEAMAKLPWQKGYQKGK